MHARNALLPGDQRGLTVPQVADRPLVQVRIDDGTQELWASAEVHAWTPISVYVQWTSPVDHLRRLDWFDPRDVRRDD